MKLTELKGSQILQERANWYAQSARNRTKKPSSEEQNPN